MQVLKEGQAEDGLGWSGDGGIRLAVLQLRTPLPVEIHNALGLEQSIQRNFTYSQASGFIEHHNDLNKFKFN